MKSIFYFEVTYVVLHIPIIVLHINRTFLHTKIHSSCIIFDTLGIFLVCHILLAIYFKQKNSYKFAMIIKIQPWIKG